MITALLEKISFFAANRAISPDLKYKFLYCEWPLIGYKLTIQYNHTKNSQLYLIALQLPSKIFLIYSKGITLKVKAPEFEPIVCTVKKRE